LARQLDSPSRCPGVISSRMICCVAMMNFQPSSSSAHGRPPKTAVPPDRQPCATRFHYPLPLAPHLLPKHGRQAALLPKLERTPGATLCQSGDAIRNDLLQVAANAAVSLPCRRLW
jgi:hypothetical protein